MTHASPRNMFDSRGTPTIKHELEKPLTIGDALVVRAFRRRRNRKVDTRINILSPNPKQAEKL